MEFQNSYFGDRLYLHPGIKLGMNEKRRGYPSDVSDEEWSFCVNYLTLMKETAPQREYSPRAVFNAPRYLVRVGGAWRMLPNDLPPWRVVHQQTQRWIKAGCFEAMAHDLRAILRMALERKADPSAIILDSRTVQSTPESGARAGFDGHKKRKGPKVHVAVGRVDVISACPEIGDLTRRHAKASPHSGSIGRWWIWFLRPVSQWGSKSRSKL
jgi:transposase